MSKAFEERVLQGCVQYPVIQTCQCVELQSTASGKAGYSIRYVIDALRDCGHDLSPTRRRKFAPLRHLQTELDPIKVFRFFRDRENQRFG